MFDICLDDPFFSVSLARVRIYYMFDLIQAAPNHASPSLQCFFPLVISCLLLMFYFRCSTTIIIATTTTSILPLLLIPLCKQVFISGAVELTTQLSKPVRILWLPKCRINKLGYLAREDYLDPLQLRVIKYCFLALLPGTIALFTGLLEVSACCTLSAMGKKVDPKVPILPSRTRRGTSLSSSAKLDSPLVMSKFDSPQLHATSAESGNMPDTFDDASTTFETTGSLGSFIEEQIAAVARFSGVELPVTKTPIGKTHDFAGLKEKLLEDNYIILDDDLCREINECVDSDPAAIKKLLAKHSLKNKFTPDPTFATSPICITDPDYDFSVDISLISTVEADPFYDRENDDAIEHLTKLTELGSLFTTDERIQNFYVTKILPFSLKGDARAWYDALPCGSIQSPQDMAISFVDKYFPAHMQHAALQRIYNFKQLQDEHLPKAWG